MGNRNKKADLTQVHVTTHYKNTLHYKVYPYIFVEASDKQSEFKMSNPDNRRGNNPNKSGQAFPSWNQPNPNDHLYWNSPQDEKSGRPPQNRVGIFGLSTPYVSPFPPHGYTNADFTGHASY